MVEDVQVGIGEDSRRFIAIALPIIFAGFFLCFRTLRGTLLPVLVVVLSIVWTMGFMGYAGLPLTVVSNALPVVMVAVASSYGIHLMYAYYEKANQYQDREEIVRQMLKKVAGPIFITGLTSAVGSFSLLIFKIISLQEFGLIGAAGFCFATLICLTVLPALLMLLPVSQGRLNRSWLLKIFLQRITRWSLANRRAVLATTFVLAPILVILTGMVRIGDNYQKFFPGDHPGRIATEVFNAKMSGMRFMDLMIEGTAESSLKLPEFFEKLQLLRDYIESLPGVGNTHSYVDVVERIREAMVEEDTLALDRQQISQFLMMYEMSAGPGEVFSLRDDDFRKAKLQIALRTSEPAEHEKVYEAVRQKFSALFAEEDAELTFGGEVMYRIALGRYIVRGKIMNIILALASVLVICTLLFRSVRRGLQTVLPIALSLLAVFGLMGLFGIRLGISTSLLTAMIVGIGVDFAVHYLMRYYAQREQGDDPVTALEATAGSTGTAILFDALSNAIGFTVLLFSGFLPVQHFGGLLSLAMILIFLVTVVIFPCVLSPNSSTSKIDAK